MISVFRFSQSIFLHCSPKLVNSFELQQETNHPVEPCVETRVVFLLSGQSRLSMPFSPHISTLCCWFRGNQDGEMRDSERQSCSLMACKVISCGLVKLKAASLGCNSRQSCPPFTLANPSFRVFFHNHGEIHGKKAERETALWGKEENDDDKENSNQALDERIESAEENGVWRSRWVFWAWFKQAAERITAVSLCPPVKHFFIIKS